MAAEHIVSLTIADAVRALAPWYPLRHVAAVVDSQSTRYVHLAPDMVDAISLERLNTGLKKLAIGLRRLGRIDILAFREADGRLYCGRITCPSAYGELVIVQMYPHLEFAMQLAEAVPCPMVQPSVSAADLCAA